MTVWWTADPRLLPSSMLRDEHKRVHELLQLAAKPRVITLLVVRHELLAAAMTDRNGKDHNSELTRDFWVKPKSIEAKVVRWYEGECEKYWQIDVDHMDHQFRRVVGKLKVPESTPWKGGQLLTFRREYYRGIDVQYYRGFDPLTVKLPPDRKKARR